METGQKTTLTNNNTNQSEYNVLSIQVSLSGLSFCVLNTKDNKFSFFKEYLFDQHLNPNTLLDKLIHCFNSETALQQNFKNVNVIHDNEVSTLVPKPLFNEDYLADYLKFNSKILRTDYITYDEILINDSVNVYVPYVNINNHIYDRFGEFEFKHFSTVVLDTILSIEKHATSPKMYVNVTHNHFEVITLKNSKLKLYNTFEYATKEDFIYYILFAIEQLNYNPEELPLIFVGKISKEDELYNIAYKYIRDISIFEMQKDNTFESSVRNDLFHNFALINSFKCG